MSKTVKGFKAFESDMTCRGFQYEIGKVYTMKGKPVICKQGFHFCKSLADCYKFYETTSNTIICKVEALGEIAADKKGCKFCTNSIRIISRVKNPREKSNTSETSTGYLNSGVCNSGNGNSGDQNFGHRNSGDRNSGFYNSGSSNSGHRNSGSHNVGNYNSGIKNVGECNSGYNNFGDYNTGNFNIGHLNTGDFNTGNYSTGIFCTDECPKIKIFDKESDWTMKDWQNSHTKRVLANMPTFYSSFIHEEKMTFDEKKEHPEYKTIGGYIKIIRGDCQSWWDSLDSFTKAAIKNELPNFDEKKFCKCIGIKTF